MGDQKPRVLVADDEPSIAKVVRKQLEAAGYAVCVAVDGQDALSQVRADPPDLIVLDVMMPKIDGYDVCQTVKQDDRLRTIPILMLTAKWQQQDQEEGLRHGADAYLAKPFQLEELLEHIHALIARHSSTSPPQPHPS